MQHNLVTGASLSGKSTLAKKLAALHTASGRRVIVLDELMDPEWVSISGAVLVTDNQEEFLAALWANRNLTFVIDEAGDSVGRYNKAMSKTATRGRHWGHIGIYITQRPAMLDTNVRGQCGHAYAFVNDEDSAEALAKAFLNKKLLDTVNLRQGEYIHAVRFGPDRRPSYTVGSVF